MPNRVPDLLRVWRDAVAILEAGVAHGMAEPLEGRIDELRRLYQRLTDENAPQTAEMEAEAASLIARTETLLRSAVDRAGKVGIEGEWL